MANLRDDLNARRDRLLATISNDYARAASSDPGSRNFEHARRNIDELTSIESTLAALQLADAQQAATVAQIAANDAVAHSRGREEEFAFWARRYMTSLAVAHGAGLFATLQGVLGRQVVNVSADVFGSVLFLFSAGLLSTGVMPLLMMARVGAQARRPKVARAMEVLVCGLAGAATVGLIRAIQRIAEQAGSAVS